MQLFGNERSGVGTKRFVVNINGNLWNKTFIELMNVNLENIVDIKTHLLSPANEHDGPKQHEQFCNHFNWVKKILVKLFTTDLLPKSTVLRMKSKTSCLSGIMFSMEYRRKEAKVSSFVGSLSHGKKEQAP